MKVTVDEQYRKAEKEYYMLPKEKRDDMLMLTVADLLPGKIYEVIEVTKRGWYRIVDESGEDYSYPPGMFKIVEE